MSTLNVEVVRIDAINKHDNAERLEIATIKGWQCVVRKGDHSPGDIVVYIPIDSVLPHDLEEKIFPPGSKVKLSKSRVKSIKLRGAVSQGLIISLKEAGFEHVNVKVGDDVTEFLGITKYEPPEPSFQGRGCNHIRPKKYCNPDFKKYTDIENIKHYHRVFTEGELVSITEKLHGTSARFAKLPTSCNSVWRKFLRLIRWLPKYEFCYGSRSVQLQQKRTYTGFYPDNVYSKIAQRYDFAKWLPPGVAVYGEIVGSGIQKGYTYGCVHGEIAFYAYDVMEDGKYLDPWQFEAWCDWHGVPRVPVLWEGQWSYDTAKELTKGDSTIGGQKVREGVVIKPINEQVSTCGRKVLKFISDDYLLGDNTDFH